MVTLKDVENCIFESGIIPKYPPININLNHCVKFIYDSICVKTNSYQKTLQKFIKICMDYDFYVQRNNDHIYNYSEKLKQLQNYLNSNNIKTNFTIYQKHRISEFSIVKFLETFIDKNIINILKIFKRINVFHNKNWIKKCEYFKFINEMINIHFAVELGHVMSIIKFTMETNCLKHINKLFNSNADIFSKLINAELLNGLINRQNFSGILKGNFLNKIRIDNFLSNESTKNRNHDISTLLKCFSKIYDIYQQLYLLIMDPKIIHTCPDMKFFINDKMSNRAILKKIIYGNKLYISSFFKHYTINYHVDNLKTTSINIEI